MPMDLDATIEAGREARRRGDLRLAAEHYGVALGLARAAGDPLAVAGLARHLGDIHREGGRGEPAEALLIEAVGLYRNSLQTRIIDLANALRVLALLRSSAGERESAARLWAEARVLYASIQVADGVAECERNLAGLAD